jgi:hypothetical protein
MHVEPKIGMAATRVPSGTAGLFVAPQLIVEASVDGVPQRTWQRKWRDVMNAHASLAEVYQGKGLDADDFTTRIEMFFKTCRELADWIDKQQTGRNATQYVNTAPSLKIGDGLAQTAKHHSRDRGSDPITAHVGKMFNDRVGIHAEVVWTSNNSGSGKSDALKLADDCIAEWRAYFQQHALDPES